MWALTARQPMGGVLFGRGSRVPSTPQKKVFRANLNQNALDLLGKKEL